MDPILLGKSVTTPESGNVYLEPKLGNRHGLIAGATGTGKTVTLMTLVEGFSKIGVPVFIADVKGDVAGLSQAGTPNAKIQERVAVLNLTSYSPKASPVTFWDLYGKLGHPVRATVSEVGPTLLSRILELNDTQSGVLDILFKLADDRGLLLMDLADNDLLDLLLRRKEPSGEIDTAAVRGVLADLRHARRGGWFVLTRKTSLRTRKRH